VDVVRRKDQGGIGRTLAKKGEVESIGEDLVGETRLREKEE